MSNPDYSWTSLLEKYIQSELSEIELKELCDLMLQSNKTQMSDDEWKTLSEDLKMSESIGMHKNRKKLLKYLKKSRHYKRQKLSYRLVRIAVATLIYCGLILYPHNSNRQTNDPYPGPRAIMVLPDGSQIVLDNFKHGGHLQQDNTSVFYNDSTVIFSTTDIKPSEKALYFRIITFRGGPYKVVLEDGSTVYLNACSSLALPVSFVDHERKVQLSGEAYFKVRSIPVAGGKRKFIVAINNHLNPGMEVEVLGTTFNIKAYDDGDSVRTTLVEGKIKLSPGRVVTLDSGQEARSIANYHFIKNMIDVSEVSGWRNGVLTCNDRPLNSILREIGRWNGLTVRLDRNFSQKYTLKDVNLKQDVKDLMNTMKLVYGIQFRINNGELLCW